MNISEFDRAGEALGKMKAATNLQEYEYHWKDFLHLLDRGWKKVLEFSKAKTGSGTQALLDKVKQSRNQDELIQYMKQARDCDEHSIREIVVRAGGQTTITGGPGGGVIIRGVIHGSGETEGLITSGNIEIKFHPSRIEIIDVMSRGVVYSPPRNHNGVQIATRIPHELAEVGLDFYRNRIAEISATLQA